MNNKVEETSGAHSADGGQAARAFEQQPNESATAYAAFVVYRELGPKRTLLETARRLGKSGSLLGRWSQRHNWAMRVKNYAVRMAAVEQAAREAVVRQRVMDWGERQEQHREEEWALRSDLIAAGRKVLEEFKHGNRGATLGDVARALDLASKLGRLSSGLPNEVKEVNEKLSGKLEMEWELALKKVYGSRPAVVEAEGVRPKVDGEKLEDERVAVPGVPTQKVKAESGELISSQSQLTLGAAGEGE